MQEVRTNLTTKHDTFLRTVAQKRGLSKAGFLHRLVQDAMDRWIEHGFYTPPEEQNTNQVEASSPPGLVFSLEPDEKGGFHTIPRRSL
jgi:hypothetical protein